MYGKGNRTGKHRRGGDLGDIYDKTYDEHINDYEWVGELVGDNGKDELRKQLGVRNFYGHVFHGRYGGV